MCTEIRTAILCLAAMLNSLGSPVTGQTAEWVHYGQVSHYYQLDNMTDSVMTNAIFVFGTIIDPLPTEPTALDQVDYRVDCLEQTASFMIPLPVQAAFDRYAPEDMNMANRDWQVQFRFDNNPTLTWDSWVWSGNDIIEWNNRTSVRNFVTTASKGTRLRIRLRHAQIPEVRFDMEFDLEGFPDAIAACRKLSPEFK